MYIIYMLHGKTYIYIFIYIYVYVYVYVCVCVCVRARARVYNIYNIQLRLSLAKIYR